MDEPTLFGISKSYWDMLNGFANWFAAASSFLAAGMALYIANRSAKPSAKLSVGHRIIFGQGGAKPYPEFAVFRIVNTGDRPIRIIQLGWKVGLIRKRYAIQMHEAMQSSHYQLSYRMVKRLLGVFLFLQGKNRGWNILQKICLPLTTE